MAETQEPMTFKQWWALTSQRFGPSSNGTLEFAEAAASLAWEYQRNTHEECIGELEYAKENALLCTVVDDLTALRDEHSSCEMEEGGLKGECTLWQELNDRIADFDRGE